MEARKNLHRLFPNLPTDEDVIQGLRISFSLLIFIEHSCSLERKLVHQGKLYITPNFLLFYATMLAMKITEQIPFKGLSIEKKRFGLKTGIEIRSGSEKVAITLLC
jgi:hypothetical protein